jgi:hypothetical protein
VPWWALFVILAIANVVGRLLLPKSIGGLLPSLLIKTWAIYLCLWIRTINPKATSIYWAIGTLLCDGILIFLSSLPDRTPLVAMGILIYAVLSIGTGITAIYIVRYELMKHYTEVEPAGLFFGGIMTFFFSYIYFQYHLCDIAESKRQESESLLN